MELKFSCCEMDTKFTWLFLFQGGHLYVCGDAKMMAKDVRNIIVEICKVTIKRLFLSRCI